MKLFGRRFFFEKVYSKKNYTIPIVIIAILLVGGGLTIAINSYIKHKKYLATQPKFELKKTIKVEINDALPEKKDYFKSLKNITVDDFDIIYPEKILANEDLSYCEEGTENTADCVRYLIKEVGNYTVVFKSSRIDGEYKVKIKAVDTTIPILVLKDVTINEGETYDTNSFIESCSDNSNKECIIYFADKDNEGNPVDYSAYNVPGNYTVQINAADESNNMTTATANLIINAKPQEEVKKKDDSIAKETTTTSCKYGNLKHSSSYIIAVKIDSTNCAISAEESENLNNKAGIRFNKLLANEIKNNYLQNTLSQLGLAGQLTVDITYGPVYNSSKKGVVGYYLMGEARQTVNGITTTIERYFIDESGNRVWKVNSLNLQ